MPDPITVPDTGLPCRVCNGSALAALCGSTEPGSPCVMCFGHSGPHRGEGDVAADWTPALPCRRCCVCPCGSTSDGTRCRFCGVTMAPGVDPPNFDPSTHRPARCVRCGVPLRRSARFVTADGRVLCDFCPLGMDPGSYKEALDA